MGECFLLRRSGAETDPDLIFPSPQDPKGIYRVPQRTFVRQGPRSRGVNRDGGVFALSQPSGSSDSLFREGNWMKTGFNSNTPVVTQLVQ